MMCGDLADRERVTRKNGLSWWMRLLIGSDQTPLLIAKFYKERWCMRIVLAEWQQQRRNLERCVVSADVCLQRSQYYPGDSFPLLATLSTRCIRIHRCQSKSKAHGWMAGAVAVSVKNMKEAWKIDRELYTRTRLSLFHPDQPPTYRLPS